VEEIIHINLIDDLHSSITQNNAEIAVKEYLQYSQEKPINITSYINTKHVTKHGNGTCLLIEVHQLDADLPRSSQP
jgi:hypothetical protein